MKEQLSLFRHRVSSPSAFTRIGFVHEFRPLDAARVQELLERRWTPAGVTLPDEQLVPEVIARLVRMTGGNFRLLTRLLAQIERVLSVNDVHLVSTAVAEAARDSLVIGPADPTTPNNSETSRQVALKARVKGRR